MQGFLNTSEQPRHPRPAIPLSGVSRVRIPPPPLRNSLICRVNAEAKDRAGRRTGSFHTNARDLLYKPVHAHRGALPGRSSRLRERVRPAAPSADQIAWYFIVSGRGGHISHPNTRVFPLRILRRHTWSLRRRDLPYGRRGCGRRQLRAARQV